MLRCARQVLRRCVQFQQRCTSMVSCREQLKPKPVLRDSSDGQNPYCAIYRYASGSKGYGCADATGYNKTVLTLTGPSVTQPTPFGQEPSTTSTASTSTTVEESTSGTGVAASNSATAVPTKSDSMSGGAIAGTVVGIIAGVAAILFLLFLAQRFLKRRARRQRNQTSRGPYPLPDQRIYDQYGKLVYSPPWPTQTHSRNRSDGQSELDGLPVSPDPAHKSYPASPPLSEAGGRPFSPETIQTSPLMSHEFSDSGQQDRPAELPGVN